MSDKISDYDYHLPEALIAQQPVHPRDAARLMVVERATGRVSHTTFDQLPGWLAAEDILVRNTTKVIPARLWGTRQTGAKVEFLLVRARGGDASHPEWDALCKPAKRAKIGERFVFGPELSGIVTAEGEAGLRRVVFEAAGDFEEALEACGKMPLPPYIRDERGAREEYQTVYADQAGSCAAPTAGLHFTDKTFADLDKAGVTVASLVLHVGIGTFRPVAVEDVADHRMHEEDYWLPPETAKAVNAARAGGGRCIAVGTTAARTLESCVANGKLQAGQGATDIFIRPGYQFGAVDGLLTNFHLPRSTLLMLVSAMMGREKALECYTLAVREQYRFYSYGDCMLIL